MIYYNLIFSYIIMARKYKSRQKQTKRLHTKSHKAREPRKRRTAHHHRRTKRMRGG